MKQIQKFTIPYAAELTVEVPQGLSLLTASDNDEGDISVYYVDQNISDDMVTLSFYVLGEGMDVADNFPGQFFKEVTAEDGAVWFVFFKQDAKKRKPIVAKVAE